MKTRKKRQIHGFRKLFSGVKILGVLLSRISGGGGGGRGGGRIRHFLPLFAGLLILFGLISYLSPPINEHGHISQYSSSFDAGNGRMNVETVKEFRVPRGGGSSGRELWRTKGSEFFYGCSNPSNKFLSAESSTHSDRHLLIATSGGLNQQRTGIVDSVVAAYMLNATLVVPTLDQKSYWKDSSNFSEIFDEDWFISQLKNDVKIIKKLPTTRGRASNPITTRAPRKCNAQCYQTRILPLFEKKHNVLLTKFDYRLSNKLATDLQKLRCRVNYHHLKFTDSINDMGRKLVDRMRMKSKHFVALHLRFEPDMLAFSGCEYGFGEKERKILATIRKRWKTLHVNPEKQRRQGRCPLTPEEVGLLLRALGYGDDVHIYVASGDIFEGEETMAPLKALFPNFHTKESLASQDELALFSPYSSRMAALDYIVCDESDMFVTNNNGNMAKILAGRRRYFGHKPTIRPNAKKLSKVFMNRDNMTWDEFSSLIHSHQIGFMGEPNEVKPGIGVFHENPAACICSTVEAMGQARLFSQKNVIIGQEVDDGDAKRDVNEATDEHFPVDGLDSESMDIENIVEIGGLPMKLDINISTLEQPERLELEAIFSD